MGCAAGTTAAAATADIAPEAADQMKAMGLASQESVDDVDVQADYAAREEMGASQPAVSQDKLIYMATVSLRSYSFDHDYEALRAKAEELGGYVDVSSVEGLPFKQSEGDGRQGNLQIRVPQEQYKALLAYVSQLGEVTSSEESVSNITQQYTETQIRTDSLKTQIARLQELMGQAENIEDIIALESQLSSVTSELEYLEAQLKQMDQQVAYSTVSRHRNRDAHGIRSCAGIGARLWPTDGRRAAPGLERVCQRRAGMGAGGGADAAGYRDLDTGHRGHCGDHCCNYQPQAEKTIKNV